jgi:hypothetical protein
MFMLHGNDDVFELCYIGGDTSSPCHVAHDQMEQIGASSEAKKVSIEN